MFTTRVTSAAVVFLAALTFSTTLWSAEAWVGVWKLNPAKSQSSSRLPKSQTFKFEAQGGGLKSTEYIVNAEGVEYRVTFRARFDGKDYPVTGSRAGVELVSVKRMDRRGLEAVLKKKDGAALATYRVVVSGDRKIMTVTSWRGATTFGEPASVRIYERQ